MRQTQERRVNLEEMLEIAQQVREWEHTHVLREDIFSGSLGDKNISLYIHDNFFSSFPSYTYKIAVWNSFDKNYHGEYEEDAREKRGRPSVLSVLCENVNRKFI